MYESNSDQIQCPIPFRNHTALLLSTALPFIQPAYRHPLELMLKFLEFSETLKFFREFHTGNLFDLIKPPENISKEAGPLGILSSYVLDLEGLLNALSGICTKDGKEVISLFLNLIRAKKFYDDYGGLFSSLFQDFEHTSSEQTSSEPASSGLSPLTALFSSVSSGKNMFFEADSDTSTDKKSDFTSLLNDEQKETLDLLKTLFTNSNETAS